MIPNLDSFKMFLKIGNQYGLRLGNITIASMMSTRDFLEDLDK